VVGCGRGLRAGAPVDDRHGWRSAGESEGALSGAIVCNSVQDQGAFSGSLGSTQLGTQCSVVQSSTTQYTKAGDAIRTRDIQLGKLTLYH
jgi:hypothetical protein